MITQDIIDWAIAVNGRIDANLVATLAGLSFPVGALLLPAYSEQDAVIKTIEQPGGAAPKEMTDLRDNLGTAATYSIWSFYCFAIALVFKISGVSVPNFVPKEIDIADLRVLSSSGAGGIGLFLLFLCARGMKRSLPKIWTKKSPSLQPPAATELTIDKRDGRK